jgi:hypothetical protein
LQVSTRLAIRESPRESIQSKSTHVQNQVQDVKIEFETANRKLSSSQAQLPRLLIDSTINYRVS